MVNNEKAFVYLKEMGYDDAKAKEVLASPIGDCCRGLLGTMEDCLRDIVGDDSVEPIKVFQKVNGSRNLLGNGKDKI